MQIEELTLYSKNLDQQEQFYTETLGFSTNRIGKDTLLVTCGESTIRFERREVQYPYHFAFLIPTGSLENAIAWCASRNIPLLPYKGVPIIHFENGRSIYFYDADGNIAEFIERPLLDYPSASSFSITSVIKVNEIGLPVESPEFAAKRLETEGRIQPLDSKAFNDVFCWVGDHHGVVIVVKEGRNWLPTTIPGVFNDFELKYSEGNIQGTLIASNGTIKLL